MSRATHALASLAGALHSCMCLLEESVEEKRPGNEVREDVARARKYIQDLREVAQDLENTVNAIEPWGKEQAAKAATDRYRGLYQKYDIKRVDGSRKHENCCYFVLDWDHDPYTIPAILAYIQACEAEYPLLARDLRREVAKRWLAKDQAPR